MMKEIKKNVTCHKKNKLCWQNKSYSKLENLNRNILLQKQKAKKCNQKSFREFISM